MYRELSSILVKFTVFSECTSNTGCLNDPNPTFLFWMLHKTSFWSYVDNVSFSKISFHFIFQEQSKIVKAKPLLESFVLSMLATLGFINLFALQYLVISTRLTKKYFMFKLGPVGTTIRDFSILRHCNHLPYVSVITLKILYLNLITNCLINNYGFEWIRIHEIHMLELTN